MYSCIFFIVRFLPLASLSKFCVNHRQKTLSSSKDILPVTLICVMWVPVRLFLWAFRLIRQGVDMNYLVVVYEFLTDWRWWNICNDKSKRWNGPFPRQPRTIQKCSSVGANRQRGNCITVNWCISQYCHS